MLLGAKVTAQFGVQVSVVHGAARGQGLRPQAGRILPATVNDGEATVRMPLERTRTVGMLSGGAVRGIG